MLHAFRSLVSPELTIVQVLPHADKVVLVARSKVALSFCPCCGRQTRRVHSHYVRRLADLPWQGRVVEIRLHARRFRCANSQCQRRIFTERLPETVRPKARRTSRLSESQLAIGFAVGGEPGARLSCKLAMPASGDTLLRMIRAAEFKSPEALVGIDDWAWRKGLRYGTIICDLERNRVIDLCRIEMPILSRLGWDVIQASR
ncbi:transposase family protein [Bradyrhizobium japonicum]|uniref:transposase family protein n=1 Tax=Bradyrhizobium japonicum TaxID=375 RepID=UPI001930B8E5|nr:transposase family protein [Bradyrhizobium japonicum]